MTLLKKIFLPNRKARCCVAVVCLVALVGCSSVKPIKPWVKPYQRDKLADPLMVQDSFPLDTGYMIHMYRSREGGRGAEGAGGGGCGCN